MTNNSKANQGKSEAQLMQAIRHQQANQFDEAQTIYEQMLAVNPQHVTVLTLLSTLHLHLGRYVQALVYIKQSLAYNAEQIDAYSIAGDACYGLGQFAAAADYYRQVTQRQPQNAKAHYDYANALLYCGNLPEQASSIRQQFEQALTLDPDYAEAHQGLGILFSEQKLFNQAVACFGRAIALKPDYLDAYIHCGNILIELQQYEFAVAHYDYALQLKPDHASTHNNRGAALNKLKRYAEAVQSYDQALARNPQLAEAYSNRSNTLLALGRYADALAGFDQAIQLEPANFRNYNNRGNLFLHLQQIDDALADYTQAIQLQPDNATAYWNTGIIRILQGDYAAGWPLYEYGWLAEGPPRGLRRHYAQPRWLGETSLAGKCILLYAEQGLGDTMQFIRYVPLVAALAARVIVAVQPSLLDLMQGLIADSASQIEWIALDALSTESLAGQPSLLNAFDVHCPLMSLPLAFNTTLESVPANIPYLSANTIKREQFQHALQAGGAQQKLRVGLVWSGSVGHGRDYKRSIPLEKFAPLLTLPLEFHSLQKEVRAADQLVLDQLSQLQPTHAQQAIIQHASQLQDFTDTAALVDALDLIISVDTSVAHLAGALGKPVWILLPLTPDYRWMLQRQDTPWYPTAQLFRQRQLDDWDSVMDEVVATLRLILEG